MKLTSIRDFRTSISSYTKRGEMMVITNHGKMVGCFLPLASTKEIPLELKREFVVTLGQKIASRFLSKKVHEEEILDDFKTFKKNRRG